MCGIAGIVSVKGLTNKEYIKRKLDKAYLYLKSRGPDEKGTWKDQNTYFLHTRASRLRQTLNAAFSRTRITREMYHLA